MNFKIILMFLLCLIFLINPVFGNSEVDDPKNYRLTEIPVGCEIYEESYRSEGGRYKQSFQCENTYVYVEIWTFPNSEQSISELKWWIDNTKNENADYYSYIGNEIYGIGDKAYFFTGTSMGNHNDCEKLYFIKNHVLIKVIYIGDINKQSESVKFAKLYENKINSVSKNVIVNEKPKNNIPFLNSSIIFGIVIVMAIIINRKKRTYKQR